MAVQDIQKPKWKVAEESILDYISRRRLAEGDALPSDRELLALFNGAASGECAKAFRRPELADGLSKQPLTRALDELARKGIIVRRAGGTTTFRSLRPRLYDLEFSHDDAGASDQEDFSFGATTRGVYGHDLKNKLIEKSLRPPLKKDVTAALERRAHEALRLRRDQPFLVVARVRIINGRPRAIHRAYLNPASFPPSFLFDHDFENESLIRIYNAAGYRVEGRETVLRARLPTEPERVILKIGPEPVLEAEQQLNAMRVVTGKLLMLQYLSVCYVDWEYRVSSSRLPSEPG